MQAASARILEIGDQAYVKSVHPERTTLLWTGWRPCPLNGEGVSDCTPSRFAAAMRDVHAGRYDVVVAFLSPRSGLHPRNWLRSWARTPWRPYASLTRVLGTSWLRWTRLPIPLVALDVHDHFGIGRHNFFVLDKADAVFKRELPADRWQVLAHTAHPMLPTLRIRRNPRWQTRLEKLRPIVLPVKAFDTSSLWEGAFPPKTVDVFFSGNVTDSSWVRRRGVDELKQLAGRGIKIDLPQAPLPHEEFLRRMSRAWLAWSPAGFGWECYRTAEAAQCLAVPVVNHPNVERHRPLLNGTHLFQYDIEPGGLVRAIEAALADKERLKRMALAAREHVLAHHTYEAVVNHIIETALSFRNSR